MVVLLTVSSEAATGRVKNFWNFTENFLEHLFWKTSANDCFRILLVY